MSNSSHGNDGGAAGAAAAAAAPALDDPLDLDGLRRRRIAAFDPKRERLLDNSAAAAAAVTADPLAQQQQPQREPQSELHSGNDDTTTQPPLRAAAPPSSSSSSSSSSSWSSSSSSSSSSSPLPQASSSSSSFAQAAPPAEEEEDNDPSPPPPPPAAAAEERTCRICFGGEEEELGRMISPCRCKGTMKYVHIGCLNEWRRVTRKRESFFECDQCHYKYQFSRTRWANVLRNEFIVTLLTLILFSLLVLVAGFVAKLLLIFFILDADELALAREAARIRAEQAAAGMPSAPRPPPLRFTAASAEAWLDYVLDGLFAAAPAGLVSVFHVDLGHMLAGVGLVGAAGAFSILYYFALNPHAFATTTRIGTSGGGGSGGSGRRDNVGSLVLVLLVLAGAAKMAYHTYRWVKDWSRRSMEMVEDRILDVGEAAAV